MTAPMATRDRIVRRIQAGDKLHMQLSDGKRAWWFESPYQRVADRVITKLLSDPASPIREAGDSLFGEPLSSQTFLLAAQ